MNIRFDEIKKKIQEKGIHLSYQRLKVFEYLYKHPCHPTVDQIYLALLDDIPTISKTTVYNTLKVMVEAGFVRVINIEDHETRYDIEMDHHGHFKCESCGMIYNFDINIELLVSEDLKKFKIQDKNVYFKGICPKCLLDNK